MTEEQKVYQNLLGDDASTDPSISQFNTEMELLSFQAERLFLSLFSRLKTQVDEQQKISLSSAIKLAKELTRDVSVLNQIKSKSCNQCISTLHLSIEKESDFQRVFAHYLSHACHERNRQSPLNSVWIMHFVEKMKISLGTDRFELAEARCQAIIEEMKEQQRFSYTALFVHPKVVAEYVSVLLDLASFLSANEKRLEWLINGMLSNPNAQTKNGLILVQASVNEPAPTYVQVSCLLDTLFRNLSVLVATYQLEQFIAPQLTIGLPQVERILGALEHKLDPNHPGIAGA
jgi:hypothetical protein